MDMEEKIVKILSEICERELNVEEVSSLRDIPTELGITSLSLVYLLVELEKEFQCKINIMTLDMSCLETLESITQFIKTCQQQF